MKRLIIVGSPHLSAIHLLSLLETVNHPMIIIERDRPELTELEIKNFVLAAEKEYIPPILPYQPKAKGYERNYQRPFYHGVKRKR